MYGALGNLRSQGLTAPVPGPDKRRKLYQTTPLGREVLHSEEARLRYLAGVADRLKL